MSKIKIGIIGHKEVPSYNGGIEAVLTEMIPVFNKENFEITIYNRWTTFYKPCEWFKRKSYSGHKIVKIPTIKKSFLNAFIYSLLASIHAAFSRYDIIHYHAEGPSAMSFIPKIMGKKIVATNHGLDWARGKWSGFASKYLLFGEKMSTKTADTLIVLSDNISKYFKDKYDKDSVKICNAIDIKEFKSADLISKEFGLKANGYFLTVGRIVEEKGLHYLIDAYKAMKTDIKLVIAGPLTNTDYCNKLKFMAKENPNIIFTDFVDGDMKQELFSNCYAYVIPSDLEGMSISLLEALAYGCRVIASNIEDNKGICDNKITFFKQGNIEDLRTVLEMVNPLPENEKIDQVELIRTMYNWKNVVSLTENVYEKVMKYGEKK